MEQDDGTRRWFFRWDGEPFAYIDDPASPDVWHLSGRWLGRLLASSNGNLYDERGRYVASVLGTVGDPRITRSASTPPPAADANLAGSWASIDPPEDRPETYELPGRVNACAGPGDYRELRPPTRDSG